MTFYNTSFISGMKHKWFALFIFFLGWQTTHAQELQCEVSVLTPGIQIADPAIFSTLETAMFEFINNRKWTDDSFEPDEKIQCTLILSITEELGNDRYRGNATIQSSRPVYNSDYQTLLFNFNDRDWEFQYVQFQPIEFQDNIFLNNLSALLAFYAYTVIGFDYDSFADKGGNPYFLKAQNIITLAQNTSEKGWKSFENLRNRFWLIENLLNPRFKNFRSAFYNYHLNGLDRMYENRDLATETITSTLQILNSINQQNPNSMIIQLFFNAKSEELLNIYADVPKAQKTNAINLLSRLDAANSEKYQNLMK